jgi:hypothetical protein
MQQSSITVLVYAIALVGAIAIIAYAGRMIRHWFPRREDHSHEILQRLSEITVAVKEQTAWLKAPPAEKEEALPVPFLKFLDEWMAAQIQQQAALDTLVTKTENLNKYIQLFCRTITGNDPGGYTEVSEEDAVVREKAVALQRRHGISWEEALKRAKAMHVYEPSNGFGVDA